MRKLMGIAATLVLLLASTELSAQPRPKCGPRDQIVQQLAIKHKEAAVAIGLMSNGSLLEIYATDDGHTWTALVTRPNGVSCLMAAGKSWAHVEPMSGPVGFTPIQAEGHPEGFDPYKGYKRSNGRTSCCDNQDCEPAPYDPGTGMMQMPNGEWVNPRTLPSVAIYFSFDGRGHRCWRGRLVCAFIPGEGA